MKEIGLNDLEMVSYDLALTIKNVYDYSRVIEWLTKCVAKRYRRGQLVLFDHLAGCSTLKRVIGQAAKVVSQWSKVTTADRRDVATYFAGVIISDAINEVRREEVVVK